jgi:pimeloyl-ACP methyl ester carboxylesterase/DNA-binding CsgD family transcriptional regulator
MPEPAQQIRFCTSRDGTRIAYAIFGTGPPLVWAQHWVHHLVLDWDDPIWHPWLMALTRRFTVIRYDWRGCGLSDRQLVPFSFDKLAEDLEAVIESVGLETFTLFGMAGAGSGVAMRYAAKYKERVSRLILFAPHTKGRLGGNPGSEMVREAEARLNVFELGWPEQTPAYGEFFTRLHIPDSSPAQLRSYNNLLRQTTSCHNGIKLLWTFWHVEVTHIIPEVSCPTLVFHSRNDCVIPFEEGRIVASLLPRARFVPLASRNHVLLGGEPAWEKFLASLDEFLSASEGNQLTRSADHLTAREREVLGLLAQGHGNREIAARLRIAEKTTRNHVSAIFGKLGLRSRAQVVARARDAGFGGTIGR